MRMRLATCAFLVCVLLLGGDVGPVSTRAQESDGGFEANLPPLNRALGATYTPTTPGAGGGPSVGSPAGLEFPDLDPILGATYSPTSADPRFQGACAECSACDACTVCLECLPCIDCDGLGAVDGCEACAPCAPCKPCNDAGCAACAECLAPAPPPPQPPQVLDANFEEELPNLNPMLGATEAPTPQDSRFQGECAACAACDACTVCVDCIPCIYCDGLGAVEGCEACAACAPCKPCNDAGCAPCAECLALPPPSPEALDANFEKEFPDLNPMMDKTTAPTATDPRFLGECAACEPCDVCTPCVECIPCIPCDGLGAVEGCEECAPCAPCKPCNDAGCAPCAGCLAPLTSDEAEVAASSISGGGSGARFGLAFSLLAVGSVVVVVVQRNWRLLGMGQASAAEPGERVKLVSRSDYSYLNTQNPRESLGGAI